MEYANIILEMLDRIKALENDMAEVKKLIQTRDVQGDTPEGVDERSPYFHRQNGDEAFSSYRSVPSRRKKDTTRYMFDGNVYLKNRLVLAVVHKYVACHSPLTVKELQAAFPRTLQGSIGVIVESKEAYGRFDYGKRFFAQDNEIVHLSDGDVLVCTQWGIGNIDNFIGRAKQLGFDITPIYR